MPKVKRYKFIFHGKGNYDFNGAKSILINHGAKHYKRTKNLKVLSRNCLTLDCFVPRNDV